MNLFGGISAGLMPMLLLLMIMPLSTDGRKFEITVTADEHAFKKGLLMKTNTITVQVHGSNKVEDLKKTIMAKLNKKGQTKYGSDPKRLTLQHGKDDEILRDGQIIGYYRIKNGDIVRLSIGEFQIVVRYEIENDVKNYTIWVKSEETVSILKKKIKNESGIKPEEQILKCNTTNGPLLEDKKALKDYGIGNGTTTIILSIEFEVVVEYLPDKSWKKYPIMVKRTDTLATLKDKIREKYTKDRLKIGSGYGIIQLVKAFKTKKREPAEDMRLNDVELWDEGDGQKTMDQCGIKEGSIVPVFYAQVL
ncbi:hypothetical protein niasHS_018136 [Heterodera schachtii]|uniref:Ubiquitin-like domain-containing protein n=1 Tax=Heterodera schachtii TaxID=97005 RepID=A0ABD2HRW6_HETSC